MLTLEKNFERFTILGKQCWEIVQKMLYRGIIL